MSNNAKNILQIYCQKQAAELPIYTQTFDEGTRAWQSTVCIAGHTSVGEQAARKAQADILAAERACLTLGLIQSKAQSNDIVVIPKLNTWELLLPKEGDRNPMFILVDYENVNKLESLHYQFVNSSGYPAYVCKFVGYCNHKASTQEPSHIVGSAASDAVDHYISFYLGMLLRELLCHTEVDTIHIIILTKDKFGAHHTNLAHEKLHVTHCATEKNCLDIMQKHNYSATSTHVLWT